MSNTVPTSGVHKVSAEQSGPSDIFLKNRHLRKKTNCIYAIIVSFET